MPSAPPNSVADSSRPEAAPARSGGASPSTIPVTREITMTRPDGVDRRADQDQPEPGVGG